MAESDSPASTRQCLWKERSKTGRGARAGNRRFRFRWTGLRRRLLVPATGGDISAGPGCVGDYSYQQPEEMFPLDRAASAITRAAIHSLPAEGAAGAGFGFQLALIPADLLSITTISRWAC